MYIYVLVSAYCLVVLIFYIAVSSTMWNVPLCTIKFIPSIGFLFIFLYLIFVLSACEGFEDGAFASLQYLNFRVCLWHVLHYIQLMNSSKSMFMFIRILVWIGHFLEHSY